MIVADLFQNGTENRMFGHPTRNAFVLGLPTNCVITGVDLFPRLSKTWEYQWKSRAQLWEN